MSTVQHPLVALIHVRETNDDDGWDTVKNPIGALINLAQGNGKSGLHWVVIHDAQVNPETHRRQLIVTDPATGVTDTRDYEDFAQHHWQDVRLEGIKTHFNLFSVIVSPRNDLLTATSPWTNTLGTLLNDSINGTSQLMEDIFSRKPPKKAITAQ